MRALAAAQAVDETGGDLRAALIALSRDESEGSAAEIDDSSDLTGLVGASPPARALLRRAIRTWSQGF